LGADDEAREDGVAAALRVDIDGAGDDGEATALRAIEEAGDDGAAAALRAGDGVGIGGVAAALRAGGDGAGDAGAAVALRAGTGPFGACWRAAEPAAEVPPAPFTRRSGAPVRGAALPRAFSSG
jgi:hypothetical protein